MRKSVKFSPEVRERAVRMVVEHRGEYESQWAAVVSIAAKIGSTPQTLLNWVRQHERDTGQREGVTTAEAQRVKELEREVREGTPRACALRARRPPAFEARTCACACPRACVDAAG
jgi:transposase